MARYRSCLILVLLALRVQSVSAQQPSLKQEQGYRGRWAASAGPRTFHGRWWAEPLANSKNAASGSWALLSDSNQVLLEGTWSARKLQSRWEGTWTARVRSGRPFSGTWSAELTEENTFEDLLKRAIEKQVTGFWASGRMRGTWWLMGPGY
jgi:hypothetical protein